MDVSAIFPEIRRHVRGVPLPTLRDAVMRSARMFCNDTWLVRRQFEFTTTVGQQRYPTSVPINEECIAIKHASIAYTTAPTNVWPLRIIYSTTMNPNIGQTCPIGICLVPYDAVALSNPPDQAYNVIVETIVQPGWDGMQIPDEIGVRYREGIGYGALEWLCRMPQNPWYDAQMAEQYRAMYNQEIVKGRGEAMLDFSPGMHEWQRRPFVRTTRGWGWGW